MPWTEGTFGEGGKGVAKLFVIEKSKDIKHLELCLAPRERSRKYHYMPFSNCSVYHQMISAMRRRKLYNSCSTIFIDKNTPTQPDNMTTLQGLSHTIYDLIKNRLADRSMHIFDERFYPLKVKKFPLDYFKKDPKYYEIEAFVRQVFLTTLRAKCAIYTAVLLKRLLVSAEIDICPKNWRRLVLAAACLAYKVSDDQDFLDMNYTQETLGLAVEERNNMVEELEDLLHYNINISRKIYCECYFEFRLNLYKNLHFELHPLNRERARELKAFSRVCGDEDLHRSVLRRPVSADNLTVTQRSRAVLS
ncbi:cyclin-Y-like protein 1 [Rhynchonycteris naso]